jgi:ABC-type branched-subunit amino acid transport system ATPase component
MSALRAVGVSKRFGGVAALTTVSLDVEPGEIHGLIGPNGSGKTTLLNVLSGYYRVDSGEIRLGDRELTLETVQRRARAGIGRTFQTPRILGALTVMDNAMLGCWRDVRATLIETAFALPRVRHEEASLRARVKELLQGVGLGYALERKALVLEHAEQRFLEIARALAARPRFLLLDEPAGGLSSREIEQLAAIIRVLRDGGLGILLVEHRTDFVFRICDRVTTLDRGQRIKHGTPDAVRTDPEVIRVYLGA